MNSTKYTGLSASQVKKLFEQYGKNSIEQKKEVSLMQLLLAQYTNVITFILFIAALFALALQEFVDAGFIFLVVMLNGLFGFVQEYRAEKALEKLKKLILPSVQVVRGGKEQEIEASLLVPGDIVVLREGDRILADGMLLENIPLQIDESVLTGESLPVERKKSDTIYSGTFILQGRGYMQVTATGMNTKLGQIASEMKGIKRPPTPLAQNLDTLGKRLAFIALGLSVILIPIGFLQGRSIENLLITVISLAVAVIPEGLPLVVTVALAVGAYRMAKSKAIVRKMNSIETLGSTSVVLSDKTGTLTQNRMTVKKQWIPDLKNKPLLLRAAVLGNTASLILKENEQGVDTLGDKTDGAFLLFVRGEVRDLDHFRDEGRIIREKPFDSEKKMIEVEWEQDGQRYHFVRGAAESVLKLISHKECEKIEKKVAELAAEGLRVVAFAYKNGDEPDYIFLGLLAIYDPPREEAKKTLQQARKAGIRVVMVTGDGPVTALKIAQEIGLIEPGEVVLTTEDVAKQTDEELLRMLPTVRVFARMRPQDKLRLVRLYRQAGFVVAVTGDGVNDALALSEAHIGVAMGDTGTDVAKEAADMVITDDNLSTVIKAVEEGRGIFDNITRVVVFLFSSNASEFLVIFLGVLLGLPIPLLPVQILYVNLISDGLPALALATDSRKNGLLSRTPRNVSEHILNGSRMRLIAAITIPFSLVLIGIYVLALQFFSVSTAQLILFNSLVVGEMIIVFVARGTFFPINKFLFASIIMVLLLQVLIMMNPFLRDIFS